MLAGLLAEVRADRAELETLLAQVNEAGARIPALEQPRAAAAARAEDLALQVEALAERLAGFEAAAQRLERASQQAEAFEGRQADAARRLDRVEAAAAALEDSLRGLGEGLEVAGQQRDQLAARIRADVAALTSLAEQIEPRVVALGQLREAVDQVGGRVASIDDLTRDLEDRIRKAQRDSQLIPKAQADLTDLDAFLRRVETRMAETRARQQELEADSQALTGRLEDLVRQVDQGLARLEVEGKSVELASRQVAELRGGLMDFERRMADAERSARQVTEAESQAADVSRSGGAG